MLSRPSPLVLAWCAAALVAQVDDPFPTATPESQ